jgi:hypothetical protein
MGSHMLMGHINIMIKIPHQYSQGHTKHKKWMPWEEGSKSKNKNRECSFQANAFL